MVEILLFLGMFCLLFFVPVQFRIYYQKIASDDHLLLEMTFLNGLLKRSRESSLLRVEPQPLKKKHTLGRWFFLKKEKRVIQETPYQIKLSDWRQILERYHHYGLGITLLSYFLPAKYHHWLLVAEDLEKRGVFTRFTWQTRLGTGGAAGTAILCGMLWGFKANSLGLLRRKYRFSIKPELRVIPDYREARLDLHFDCIFRVKLGHIIIAALIARFRQRLLKGGVGIERASN